MTVSLSGLAGLARADQIRSQLRSQTIRPIRGGQPDFTHLVLIETGHAHVLNELDDHAIGAGSAMILPPIRDTALTISAGSKGWMLGAGPGLMADAIGNKAESVLLQAICSRPAVVSCDVPTFAAEFQPLASLFHKEVTQSARGSQMAAAAYLRLLLVAFWRQGRFDAPVRRGRTIEPRVIDEFRRLVEMHYHRQIPVAAYADLLGLSYDRLHAVCGRALGRSPLQLIHQRLLREAAMRLERSGEPIQQIADQLGFSDTTQFSHFFKRCTSYSPRDYRKRADLRARGESGIALASFADWP